MLRYSSIPSLHLLKVRGPMDSKGKVKLSLAILQIFLQGFQFEKHLCFSGIFTSHFFSKFQPRQGENLQTLNHIAAPAVFNIFACNTELSKPFSHSSHTYGDPN